MMKIMTMVKPVLAASVLAASFGATADSFIRVINNTGETFEAIWQAGGCARTATDPTGDQQFTVCKHSDIGPGEEDRFDFGAFTFDRSVKVFQRSGQRVAYCNSMDYASVTLTGGGYDVQVEYTCP